MHFIRIYIISFGIQWLWSILIVKHPTVTFTSSGFYTTNSSSQYDLQNHRIMQAHA